MADSGKPKSARISEAHLKQLKNALKDSTAEYNSLFEKISDFQREEDKARKNELEDSIQNQLKSTHDLCLKLQREIEVIEHKLKQANKSSDSAKKNVSAFAADFRLTPEEQDIAYEFRAKVMRKIHSQNQNIKKELELHEKKADLKKCQQLYKKQVEDQTKSQTTLVRLTKVYEKQATSAEQKSTKLEAQLKEAQEVIGQYEELFASQGGNVESLRKSMASSDKKLKAVDLVRKNEVIREENDKLKSEIRTLKADNKDLMNQVKRAEVERDEAQHALGTSEMSRQELKKRFEKEQKQHQMLRSSLNNQAANWLQEKKGIRILEEASRQEQITPVSPLAAKERLYQYPVKKNVDQPRQMKPIETYGT